MSPFGTAFRECRMSSGVTLRDMACQLGVSYAYLSEVERGHTQRPLTTERILDAARILSLSVERTERLLAIAAENRGAVLLPVVSAAHQRLGARLQRKWATLTEHQLQKLLEMLPGKESLESERPT